MYFQSQIAMMSVLNKYVLIVFLLCFFNGFSQQKKSDKLKKQQNELTQKINFTENLLSSTIQNKSDLAKNITLISNKIQYREALLNNISLQLKDINIQILDLEKEIEEISELLLVLEEQYKKMIIQAYKMRSNSASIYFILSSSNYNQANKRMVYLNQMAKYRSAQIKKIQNTKLLLEEKLKLLNEKKMDQVGLIKNKESEKRKYVSDRLAKQQSISSLDGKEKELNDELLKQKKKYAEIRRAITKAINKEIAEANRKAKEKPKTIKETKEVALSNAGFEANKGRLPWPVSKGEITKGFGKQAHPIHAGVFTYNNGVDITTVRGALVRNVYKGVVSSVLNIPGAGKAVIIAHGNYRTIYSNLQDVYVKKGDLVETKKEIGSLMVGSNGELSDAHFEIRKITADGQILNLNPSFWLYK